jgi:predicted nucleic acid-binding protein
VTLVVDASLVVAALVDRGSHGTWAEQQLRQGRLAAPHLMPVEAANILQRAAIRGDISQDIASLAHVDLLGLTIDLFPYEPFASRVWQLRPNLTTYDGWYVALAEALDASLATLDAKLAQATGPLCPFLLPERYLGPA